jgi:hypothetical protein
MSEPNKTSIKLRLSDTQLIALSSTSQREDGAITLPDRIKGAAAVNLIGSLVAKGLVCETPAVGGMPVARRDEEGRPFALVITGLGRASINASEEVSANRNQEDEAAETQIGAPSAEQPPASDVSEPLQRVALLPAAAVAKPDSAPLDASLGKQDASGEAPAAMPATGMPRDGSKLANVIGLLDRPDGASLDDLIQITNWLPHTLRAALTGLRKRGLDIERRREDGATRYRIVDRKSLGPAARSTIQGIKASASGP